MTGHYIERCKECGAIIAQCRCPDEHKAVRLGICERCKEKQRIVEEMEKTVGTRPL